MSEPTDKTPWKRAWERFDQKHTRQLAVRNSIRALLSCVECGFRNGHVPDCALRHGDLLAQHGFTKEGQYYLPYLLNGTPNIEEKELQTLGEALWHCLLFCPDEFRDYLYGSGLQFKIDMDMDSLLPKHIEVIVAGQGCFITIPLADNLAQKEQGK